MTTIEQGQRYQLRERAPTTLGRIGSGVVVTRPEPQRVDRPGGLRRLPVREGRATRGIAGGGVRAVFWEGRGMKTAVKQPDPVWVEIHQACERWSGQFGTSRGWWLNGAVAIYLGTAARKSTRWVAECDCRAVYEDDGPACCACHDGGLGTMAVCDDDDDRPCQWTRWESHSKPWNMRPLLQQAAAWPETEIMLGKLFVDGIGNAHVPVLLAEVELFAVNPAFLTAAMRFGFPTDWRAARIEKGWCLIGYQGTGRVAFVMAESRRR